MNRKYFLDQDCSSHWYLVPEEHKEDFKKWSNLDEDNPEAWKTPDYAIPIGGHPNNVLFEFPVVNGEEVEPFKTVERMIVCKDCFSDICICDCSSIMLDMEVIRTTDWIVNDVADTEFNKNQLKNK